MDKSGRYIDMCNKAVEVQQRWKPCHGDFFVGENGRIQCWISGRNPESKIKKGFAVKTCDNIIQITKFIWLPRLDQLIEMAQVQGRRYDSVTTDFHRWTKTPYPHLPQRPTNLFSSLEQLWLAFVMEQKHRKRWWQCNWQPMQLRPGAQK